MSGKHTKTIRKQNYTIELMRFLMAVCIVNFHFFHVNNNHEGFFFAHGAIGVEFFFLVSGYLMASSAKRLWSEETDRSIGKTSILYVLRKARAFVVPFVVIWIVSFIAIHFINGQYSPATWIKDFFRSIFELFFIRSAGFNGYYSVGQTWYLSAMLLAMLLCFPLLLKFKKTYLYVIAPLSALFILGFLNHEYGGIANISEFTGIVFKHFLRAIGVINLGVSCYALASCLQKVKFTGFGFLIISLIEIGCYAYTFFYMNWRGLPNQDFVICFVMMAAITITFSQNTILNRIFGLFWPLCKFLGKSSLYIYLSHILICKRVVPHLEDAIPNGWVVYGIGIALIAALTAALWIVSAVTEHIFLPLIKRALVKPQPKQNLHP